MKVLTVAEPWLSAIVRGCKNVENRSIGMKPQLARLEGQLLGLHGALRWSSRGASDPRVCAALGGGLLDPPARVAGYSVHPRCDGFGLIVATARVDEVHTAHRGVCDPRVCFPWGEWEYVHADGHTVRDVVHVVLADVGPLDCVIPARGRLGLWDSDELDDVVG